MAAQEVIGFCVLKTGIIILTKIRSVRGSWYHTNAVFGHILVHREWGMMGSLVVMKHTRVNSLCLDMNVSFLRHSRTSRSKSDWVSVLETRYFIRTILWMSRNWSDYEYWFELGFANVLLLGVARFCVHHFAAWFWITFRNPRFILVMIFLIRSISF